MVTACLLSILTASLMVLPAMVTDAHAASAIPVGWIIPGGGGNTPQLNGSVFNVFSGGKVTLGDTVNTQAFCNPNFYDAPQLNVETANLLGTTQCKNNSSTVTGTAALITASGTSVARQTLPAFLSTTNPLDVNFANGSQILVNNGVTSSQINGNGQLIVTSSSPAATAAKTQTASVVASTVPGGGNTAQTLTLSKQGSTLTLPAGEYAKVNLQVNGILRFQAGTVPTRIKQLNLSNCNGTTMEFEPGDYYIENAVWQQACHLKVGAAAAGNNSTSVNLYFKNAFTLNSGPTCWNINGTCGSSMTTAQMQTQHPEQLKLYLYSGNFATAQGAQIAAGIYVDQGDIKLTTGNNFVFLGDMFASNIS
ncbi:hypothetical protein, partial [Undibacterium sp. TJN19]|uniref:hypothetical protein n=1 Tax=Undibacterium sp. TJN19 TaxID=3413055 RepID=UPI003BF3285C